MNYRRYTVGHGLSNTGRWVQLTAELWLILQLTDSGFAVSLHSILRFGPVLLFGAHGGLLTDRVDRCRLLYGTQASLAVCAIIIALASWTDSLTLWLIYAVVAAQGIISAVDTPLRQAFVRDLVPDDDLGNAVSLHASVSMLTAAVGPAIAGLLIAGFDIVWCFIINAATYCTIMVVLSMLDRNEMRPHHLVSRGRRLIRQGVAYAWQKPAIRESLLVCLVAGIFGWNWTTLVPFYATDEFSGEASLYGVLLSILSLGAAVGTLTTARLTTIKRRHLARLGFGLVMSLSITTVAPTVLVGAIGLFLLGATAAGLIVSTQARIQLNVSDAMSGRVIALFSIVLIGSKPFGALVAGWLTDLVNSRFAFGVGAGMVAATVFTVLRVGGHDILSNSSAPSAKS